MGRSQDVKSPWRIRWRAWCTSTQLNGSSFLLLLALLQMACQPARCEDADIWPRDDLYGAARRGSLESLRIKADTSGTSKRVRPRRDEEPAPALFDSPRTASVQRYRAGAREHAWSGQQHRALVDGASLGANTASMFWWDNVDFSYVQAGDLCSSYGGTLAVLALDPSIPANLQKGVQYWIGLFNAAQLPGVNGAWSWVDQTSYSNNSQQWGQGQPMKTDPNEGGDCWCVYLAFETSSSSWRWFTGECTKQRAVLCELPSTGSSSLFQPFSCVQGMSIGGDTYKGTFIEDNDLSQYPQLCAAACRGEAACNAFRLTGSKCELQNRPAPPVASPVNLAVDPAITVSCLRFGLDFVNLGNAVAATTLSDSASGYKCITDYRINLNVAQNHTGMCDASQCASLCSTTTWGNNSCTAFLHSRSRCRCQLGYSPLYGTDEAVSQSSGAGYIACVRSDEDWLRFGALNDPSTTSASLGNRVFTLHPERLSYDTASTVCRTQAPAGGTLASLTSLGEALLVASRLLLHQSPRLLTPLLGQDPGMYGVWLGLATNGSQLLGLLDNTPGATTQGMAWDDGNSVNRTLLQLLWAVEPNGTLSGLPDEGSSRVCTYMSNSTSLVRPGLAVASACNWELPFVCESEYSQPPPPPPFPPQSPSSSVVALALNVAALPGNTPVPGSLTTVLTGQPTILTVPDTGVLMWIQPPIDVPVPQKEANDWCGIWNASLTTVYNQTAETSLTAAGCADPTSPPYWINLAVNQSTMEWQWNAPNTPENSTKYLSGFTSWCLPEGQDFLGGEISASGPPSPEDGLHCAQLTFDPNRCPDAGWGWMARNCSETGSYMCMASPRGSPGRFFCADGYDLGGTVVGATNFTGATPVEAASYCSDLCTAQAACHAFTVMGTVCLRKSRNASSLALDVVRPNVTVGCFKYGLLWDMLGGQVAVQTKVAADATSRFRCVRSQDVARTNLQQLLINNCRVSDCTAMCFATRSCQVAVYEHSSCMCTLARNPLTGSDGTNKYKDGITTCIYDEEAAFMGLGLVRSAAYITPPVDGQTPAGSSGDWLGGGDGSGTNTDSGNITDIDFVPSGRDTPPATNAHSSPSPPSPALVSPSPPPLPPLALPPPLQPGQVTPTFPPPASPFSTEPPIPGLPIGVLPPPPRPPRPPPPPALAASDGGSSFGLTQMIAITASVCGVMVLLLIGAVVFVMRRRSAAAQLRLEAERKGDKSGLRVSSHMALSAVRAAKLSPDLERAITQYIEGWGERSLDTASPGGSPSAQGTLTIAQAAELQAAIRREQGIDGGSMDPAAVLALERLLQSMQNSNSSPPVSGSGGQPSSLDATGATTGPAGADRPSLDNGGPPSSLHEHAASGASTIVRPPGSGVADAHNAAMASKSGVCSSYITLSRLLGAGSFGTVYEGMWRRQTVAVKIIPHSPAAAPRVKNEVELSMQFDHPNVVRSYFYETFDSRAMNHMAQMEAKTAQRESQETWIVLEFCSEGSLASRLYSHANNHAGDEVMVPRPLHERDPCIASLEGILSIAQNVAQGMAYMHSLAICHGDLKCENVLLGSPFGGGGAPPSQVVAKVGDFGLSRAIGDVSSHLSTATVGTVTHMPPELLLSGRLRPSCDVYSFGIMLWQLYTGAVPYAGMRYAEIVYKVAVCNLRPLFPLDTPTPYRELAESCWQSDAAARPSFEQVVAKLSELREKVPLLEAERQRFFDHEITPPHSGGNSISSASTDITLLSPWINACPNPGSSGLPVGPPAHLAWAVDLLSVATCAAPGPTPTTTITSITTPATPSPTATSRDPSAAALSMLHPNGHGQDIYATHPPLSSTPPGSLPHPALSDSDSVHSTTAFGTLYTHAPRPGSGPRPPVPNGTPRFGSNHDSHQQGLPGVAPHASDPGRLAVEPHQLPTTMGAVPRFSSSPRAAGIAPVRPPSQQAWPGSSSTSTYASPRDKASIMIDSQETMAQVQHRLPLIAPPPPPLEWQGLPQPGLTLQAYSSVPRPVAIPLLQPHGPPPRQRSFHLPSGGQQQQQGLQQQPSLQQLQQQLTFAPPPPAVLQPAQPAPAAGTTPFQQPHIQQQPLAVAGSAGSSLSLAGPAGSLRGSRGREIAPGSSGTKSRAPLLPNGAETHVALRAMSNSQVVMGMHAHALSSAHGIGMAAAHTSNGAAPSASATVHAATNGALQQQNKRKDVV